MTPPSDQLLSATMSLARLTLTEFTLPQAESFRSAIGDRGERRALLVRWTDADGRWGIGECSCRPDPFYNGEFVDGAARVLREFIFPLLSRQGTVGDVVAVAGRVRGWNFTTAALLDAVFDLLRRRGEADALDSWHTPPLDRIPAGISLGIFPTPDAAVERVGRALAEGYRRIKLKVAPGMDLNTLRAVRAAFPAAVLGFDANGTLLATDPGFLTTLAGLAPVMLEQPFPPDRLDLAAGLRERFPELRVCLDESVEGYGELVSAHRLGALDELNVKPGRVGGMLEALRLLAYCEGNGIPVWVGGMFETGVGRANSLRLAARMPEAQAHDLSPSRRYFPVDVVEEPAEMDAEGFVAVPTTPVTIADANIDALQPRVVDLERPWPSSTG